MATRDSTPPAGAPSFPLTFVPLAVPLRRCQECARDLGDPLLALRCPRFGKPRVGVETRCAALLAKDGAP